MSITPEIIPVSEQDPNASFHNQRQLQDLIFSLAHLRLTVRGTAIQDGDKAGHLDARYVVYTSNAVADTEDTIPHALGRVPVGYIPVKQDKAGTIYDGSTAWTTTNIYLKASVASMALTIMLL